MIHLNCCKRVCFICGAKIEERQWTVAVFRNEDAVGTTASFVYPREDVAVPSSWKSERVKICRFEPAVQVESHIFHWKCGEVSKVVIRAEGQPLPTTSEVWKFACATAPTYRPHSSFWAALLLSSLLHIATWKSSGRFTRLFRALSTELQLDIVKLCSPFKSGAVAIALVREGKEISGRMHQASATPNAVALSRPIYSSRVAFLGSSYISSISNEHCQDHDILNLDPSLPVVVELDPFGVLRITTDVQDLLSKRTSPGVRYRVLDHQRRDVGARLRLKYKGFWLGDALMDSGVMSPLWNTPLPPSPQLKAENCFVWRFAKNKSEKVFYHQRQCIDWISLTDLKGLVVKCLEGGTCTVRAVSSGKGGHYEEAFDQTEAEYSVFIYFPVAEDERIIGAWMLLYTFQGMPMPALVILTDKQRYRRFGPYVEPEQRIDYNYQPLFGPLDDSLTDICFDARGVGSAEQGLKFGTKWAQGLREAREYPPWPILPPTRRLGVPNYSSYYSELALSSITSVRSCVDDKQEHQPCIGLLVEMNSRLETLGQWRPYLAISEPFNQVEYMSFREREINREPYICEVEFGKKHESEDRKSVRLSGRLIWWFTHGGSSLIQQI